MSNNNNNKSKTISISISINLCCYGIATSVMKEHGGVVLHKTMKLEEHAHILVDVLSVLLVIGVAVAVAIT